jgi:hypothetical protein
MMIRFPAAKPTCRSSSNVGESGVVWDKKIKITPSVTSYIFLNI